MTQRGDAQLVNSGGTLVNGAVMVLGECVVRAIHVVHSSGAAGVIQIFDAASEPIDTSVPLISHQVAANSDADIETFDEYVFQNGVYICESTTTPTKTIDAGAHLFITVAFVRR